MVDIAVAPDAHHGPQEFLRRVGLAARPASRGRQAALYETEGRCLRRPGSWFERKRAEPNDVAVEKARGRTSQSMSRCAACASRQPASPSSCVASNTTSFTLFGSSTKRKAARRHAFGEGTWARTGRWSASVGRGILTFRSLAHVRRLNRTTCRRLGAPSGRAKEHKTYVWGVQILTCVDGQSSLEGPANYDRFVVIVVGARRDAPYFHGAKAPDRASPRHANVESARRMRLKAEGYLVHVDVAAVALVAHVGMMRC